MKRDDRLDLRMSKAERRKVRAAAKLNKLSEAEYARRRIMGALLTDKRKPKRGQEDALAGTESQPEHGIAAFEATMGRKPSSPAEYLEWWGEQETDVFIATQSVDFGEGWKTIEAESFNEDTAGEILKCKVAQYRRQQAESQCIAAGGVERWYSSLSPALAQEWADLKQSLLAWERQAKQDQEYWQQVKRAESPAAPTSPATTLADSEAQRAADVKKAIDDDRKRTAALTGIML